MKELEREYIDVYHFHQVHDAADLAARRDGLDFLLDCKRKGRIRAIGCSVHTVEAARAVVAEPDIDVLFPILNYRGLGIKDGSVDGYRLRSVAGRCPRDGHHGDEAVGGGHLRRTPKDAFKFARQLGIVDSICMGMKSVAEVEMNVRLMEGRTVPKKILSRWKPSRAVSGLAGSARDVGPV